MHPPCYCTLYLPLLIFTWCPYTTTLNQYRRVLGTGLMAVAFGEISIMQGIRKCILCHSLLQRTYFLSCQRSTCGITETREKLSIVLLNWHSTHATFWWQSIIKLPYFFAPYSCHYLKFSPLHLPQRLTDRTSDM